MQLAPPEPLLSVVLLLSGALASCGESPARRPVPANEARAADPEALARSAGSTFSAGDSTRALEGLEQAAALFAAAGRQDKELDTWIQAAVVVSEAGAPERAIERLRQVLDLLRAFDLPEVEGLAWVHLARSQTLIGLIHAANEAARVARIFSSDTEHRATEARFKAEAGGHPYLHLATHGLVDDTTPMVSGLLLEPGDGETACSKPTRCWACG